MKEVFLGLILALVTACASNPAPRPIGPDTVDNECPRADGLPCR